MLARLGNVLALVGCVVGGLVIFTGLKVQVEDNLPSWFILALGAVPIFIGLAAKYVLGGRSD